MCDQMPASKGVGTARPEELEAEAEDPPSMRHDRKFDLELQKFDLELQPSSNGLHRANPSEPAAPEPHALRPQRVLHGRAGGPAERDLDPQSLPRVGERSPRGIDKMQVNLSAVGQTFRSLNPFSPPARGQPSSEVDGMLTPAAPPAVERRGADKDEDTPRAPPRAPPPQPATARIMSPLNLSAITAGLELDGVVTRCVASPRELDSEHRQRAENRIALAVAFPSPSPRGGAPKARRAAGGSDEREAWDADRQERSSERRSMKRQAKSKRGDAGRGEGWGQGGGGDGRTVGVPEEERDRLAKGASAAPQSDKLNPPSVSAPDRCVCPCARGVCGSSSDWRPLALCRGSRRLRRLRALATRVASPAGSRPCRQDLVPLAPRKRAGRMRATT